MLKDNLNKSEVLVYSFDKSLKEITQTCKMDLIIRCWNNDALKGDVRYWDLVFQACIHQDFLKQFNKITSVLDPKKLYQISMDEPKVNTKLYRDIVPNQEQSMFNRFWFMQSAYCTWYFKNRSQKEWLEIEKDVERIISDRSWHSYLERRRMSLSVGQLNIYYSFVIYGRYVFYIIREHYCVGFSVLRTHISYVVKSLLKCSICLVFKVCWEILQSFLKANIQTIQHAKVKWG